MTVTAAEATAATKLVPYITSSLPCIGLIRSDPSDSIRTLVGYADAVHRAVSEIPVWYVPYSTAPLVITHAAVPTTALTKPMDA
jgi:hypothetical protein